MPLHHPPFLITINLQYRLYQSGAKFAGQPSEDGDRWERTDGFRRQRQDNGKADYYYIFINVL